MKITSYRTSGFGLGIQVCKFFDRPGLSVHVGRIGISIYRQKQRSE